MTEFNPAPGSKLLQYQTRAEALEERLRSAVLERDQLRNQLAEAELSLATIGRFTPLESIEKWQAAAAAIPLKLPVYEPIIEEIEEQFRLMDMHLERFNGLRGLQNRLERNPNLSDGGRAPVIERIAKFKAEWFESTEAMPV